jgi:hypothetical protein
LDDSSLFFDTINLRKIKTEKNIQSNIFSDYFLIFASSFYKRNEFNKFREKIFYQSNSKLFNLVRMFDFGINSFKRGGKFLKN